MFCDFHRERAWKRWLRANVQEKDIKAELEGLLHDVAVASTPRELEDAFQQLSSADAFNEKLKHWFLENWWNHREVGIVFPCLNAFTFYRILALGSHVPAWDSHCPIHNKWR
jgi:hypothetical protein